MRMVSLLAVALWLTFGSSALGTQNALKDPDGKTVAVILDCNSCEKKGRNCESGVEDGFHEGSRCGRCLLTANFGSTVGIPYDVRVLGTLKDEKGDLVTGKFVQLFLPNANKLSVRTRTNKMGVFVLRMGPTGARKSKKPLTLDLGERKVRKDSESKTYMLFMLPENHKPCEAETGTAEKP